MANRNRVVPLPSEDTSSLYFLHPSDNPGINLVQQQLTGSNYAAWSRAFSTALLAKNKLVFVDGSILRPARDDLLYQPWIRCNSMVISWLRNSVSSQICSSIMYLDDAYAIWFDLKERFSIADSARIYQLRQQLMTLSQGSSDVTSYFTNLRILWDEYRNSQPTSWCTCTRCTCDSASKWNQHQENECTMQFLIGLNASFSQLRSHILSMIPLPSLSKVFSLVIQEERQRSIDGNNTSSFAPTRAPVTSELPFANAASSFGRGYNKFLCSHCGRTNHPVEKCFLLHGFPPGFGRGKGKYPPAAGGFAKPPQNSGFAGNQNAHQQRSINFVEEPADLPSLDQYQQLISLLQSHKLQTLSSSAATPATVSPAQPSTQASSNFSGTVFFSPSINSISSSCSSSSTWILDTGATHHVCYDQSLFNSTSPSR
ncbi:uncharacterized protein LOC121781795 [Salvia splendens]|uniref:uncharacterized protein LOC121781795 n=1 Tax=Salvia splendens TaxID=180675 RepID=UPI001C27C793|nr:uncharacterized protein LOC121781795 [Salvia splendens]